MYFFSKIQLFLEAKTMKTDNIFKYIDTWLLGTPPEDMLTTITKMNNSRFLWLDYNALIPMLHEACLRDSPYMNATNVSETVERDMQIDDVFLDSEQLKTWMLFSAFTLSSMLFCCRRTPKKKI